MADPRFYENCGPFTLAGLCAKAGVKVPDGADGQSSVADVAGLESAGPSHLAFLADRSSVRLLSQSRAGFCFVPAGFAEPAEAAATLFIRCANPQLAFAAAANAFYPRSGFPSWEQETRIHPSAQIDESAILAPGVVVGPKAEIGGGTHIGPNAVIGHGVCIGRDCDIGSNVSIISAYIGDGVLILPGAQIGQPGFGFASSASGHTKIPQLGRVIVQDKVEIGAATTIDRGALGDTVIGEGSKIDNLVQIGHNTRVGRHCIIVGQAGVSGSCELGDFVVLGGQVGLADHVKIGDGARLAARSGVAPGEMAGGKDYGGTPAKPVKEWAREIAAVSLLARRRKRDRDG